MHITQHHTSCRDTWGRCLQQQPESQGSSYQFPLDRVDSLSISRLHGHLQSFLPCVAQHCCNIFLVLNDQNPIMRQNPSKNSALFKHLTLRKSSFLHHTACSSSQWMMAFVNCCCAWLSIATSYLTGCVIVLLYDLHMFCNRIWRSFTNAHRSKLELLRIRS